MEQADKFLCKNFTHLQVEINRQDDTDEYVELSDRNLSFKYCVPIHSSVSVVAAELRSVAAWLDKMAKDAEFEAAVAERTAHKGKKP